MKQATVYMLLCADGSFYTGWTNDLPKRIETHSTGRGAKYTRSRRPLVLAYAEAAAGRGEAMRREAEIKGLSHAQKAALAEAFASDTAEALLCQESENANG